MKLNGIWTAAPFGGNSGRRVYAREMACSVHLILSSVDHSFQEPAYFADAANGRGQVFVSAHNMLNF